MVYCCSIFKMVIFFSGSFFSSKVQFWLIMIHITNVGDQHITPWQRVLIGALDRHGALVQIDRFDQDEADHIGLD